VTGIRRLLPKSKQGKRLAQELATISKLVSNRRSKAACRALGAFRAELRKPGLSRARRAAVTAAVRRLSRSLRC
jgi:hypothetical protein